MIHSQLHLLIIINSKLQSLLCRDKSTTLKTKFDTTLMLNRHYQLLSKVYTTSNLKHALAGKGN